MAANRAFRGLANLRESFDQPYAEDEVITDMPVGGVPDPRRTRSSNITSMPQPTTSHISQTSMERHALPVTPVSPITGKVDRRRLKKVLKTPSVSLSVAVRSELHEEVSTMLFARKTTWIAILDELLTNYVSEARTNGVFPK